MEEWIGARVGSSRCCSVCGESECRTVAVEATTFEAIPQELFLKAALVASSQLLELMTEAPSHHGQDRCCESLGGAPKDRGVCGIPLLNAHPDSGSFCDRMANAYGGGANLGGHQVKAIVLRDLNFDLVL